MRRHTNWLAGPRKWRRVVSGAVLPAFAWWSLSASACLGMPMAAEHAASMTAHGEHDGSAHAMHDSNADIHDHASDAKCPHCRPTIDEGQSAPVTCVTADGTSNVNRAPASPAADHVTLLALVRVTPLSWSAAPPPLIKTTLPVDVPFVAPTPLNVRHCVFLI